jgi:hypothetical protein
MPIRYFFGAIVLNLAFSSIALAISDSSDLSQTNTPSNIVNLKQPDEDVEAKLKNVAASAHHLQKTIHEIIYEIARQEYVTASEPNVIGPTVIPAIPNPTGAIAMGNFLPPRKKYMDLFAEQSRSLLMMLNEEGSTLPDSLEADNQANTQLANVKTLLNDLRVQNDALLNSMTGPKYNNILIGKQAIKMSDDLDQIQKLLKECEKHVQKYSK